MIGILLQKVTLPYPLLCLTSSLESAGEVETQLKSLVLKSLEVLCSYKSKQKYACRYYVGFLFVSGRL